MHVLLIYCHPCPDSFSATLLEVATEALRSAGHEVVVRQLYAERFDPVLDAEERRRKAAPSGVSIPIKNRSRSRNDS